MANTKAASPPAARSRAEICEAARQVNCGECWRVPGEPCTLEGDHVARYARAMRRGLISGPELIAILQALDAFTNSTIVCAVPGGVS